MLLAFRQFEMSPGSAGLGTKILRIIWDNDDKSREERKFVHKLDSVLLTTVSIIPVIPADEPGNARILCKVSASASIILILVGI